LYNMDPGSAAHRKSAALHPGPTLTGNRGTFETSRRSTTAGTLFRLCRGGLSEMLAPSSLLRTGLALKLSQIKLATRSYLRDRTNQATGTVASYATAAAGLFAAAGPAVPAVPKQH
jgi:hypothetical protein